MLQFLLNCKKLGRFYKSNALIWWFLENFGSLNSQKITNFQHMSNCNKKFKHLDLISKGILMYFEHFKKFTHSTKGLTHKNVCNVVDENLCLQNSSKLNFIFPWKASTNKYPSIYSTRDKSFVQTHLWYLKHVETFHNLFQN